MNAFLTLVNSWLLGGLTYPALTFVITAAMKSTAIVLLAWSVSTFLRRKPALMRLWLWRGCSVALLGVLLWALAPGFVDSWRVRLTVSSNPMLSEMVQQAQQLDLLSRENAPSAPQMQPVAPLMAYTASAEAAVPLEAMRMPWLERVEGVVFHAWWVIALLLIVWRVFRAVCGHFWLRRQSVGVLSGTEHKLVRDLTSPVVTGWRKACIWLPEEAAQWPEAKVRAVCLHEMAHHARQDGAWQWLGWLTASVWWWNPLAWLSLRRLTAEAELSADESALSQHIAATDYAQMLVEIAAGGDLSTPATGVAMLGRSGIENRVKALLSGAGQSGVFGRKTRLVLILSAVAAVMAAGVEVRHAMQYAKPGKPLSEAEKALAKRALTVLEAQLEKLQRVHVKMTETWTMEGVSSPRPSIIEAWLDETAKQSRVEYRPRITRWTNGAAPWYIKDNTEATDGKRGWRYEGSDGDEVSFSREARDAFYSYWEARPRVRELVRNLQDAVAGRFGMPTDQFVSESDGRIVIELHLSRGKQVERWEVDVQRGLAIYRLSFPERAEPFSMQWSVQKWAQLADGTAYPARMEWKFHTSEGPGTYTSDVQSLELIAGVPAALLAPPEKKASPYVATDGVARHGDWLETRFVHALNGKPVPEVKVHFGMNGGERTELISDAQGVLRIPLPKEEVKSLRYWGMKPGFVMQRVTWSRRGDPLKLPDVYETKLYPAGKPIGGTIVDAAGKPVADAKVEITHTGGATRWDVFSDVHDHGNGTVKTNAEGKWSMRGFAEDLDGLVIRVEHPKYKRLAIGYEMASGQPLESLRDGSGRIVLKSEGLEVSGVVSDASGNKVPNCSVTLTEDKNGRFDEPNAKTDASGRFTLLLHEAGKEWFTFEAAGFAPQMVELDLNAESAKKLIVVNLRPGAIFKAQVLDEAGKPLPGIRMIADRWQEKRTLWYEGVTDAEGCLEWHGAPVDAVKWTFLSPGRVLRDLPLKADGSVQVVVLRPALRFTGTVVDAQTGLPLKNFQITPGDTRRSAADIYWQDDRTQTFHDGEFTIEEEGMRFEHKLRITAEGYEPFETALFTPKQQTETLTVKLEPRK